MKRILRFPANILIASSTNLLKIVRGISREECGAALAEVKRMMQEKPGAVLAEVKQTTSEEQGATLAEVKQIVEQEQSLLTAKFLPYHKGQPDCWIPKSFGAPTINPDDGLPIPPRELWAGYGETPAQYLHSGQTHFKAMMDVLKASGYSVTEDNRILDFGSASGRIIRHFVAFADKCEIWGVDIHAERVLWCQRHLSPPFNFFTTTTFPHLPFEDNYFNLIYAGSIFTHIGDLEDAWLLELRRILRPGGRLYITIHDNHTIDLLMSGAHPDLHDYFYSRWPFAFEKNSPYLNSDFSLFMLSRNNEAIQVFHDIDFLRTKWSGFLDIISITPDAYWYQTAITLTKSLKSKGTN